MARFFSVYREECEWFLLACLEQLSPGRDIRMLLQPQGKFCSSHQEETLIHMLKMQNQDPAILSHPNQCLPLRSPTGTSEKQDAP